MVDLDKLRAEFTPSPVAHSAYLTLCDGEVKLIRSNDYCFAPITYKESGRLDHIFIYFGKNRVNKYGYENSVRWCNWVIYESFWADAFITKDAAEGLKKGFELDTRCERILLQAGMSILRHPFEMSWGWQTFLDLGFDEYESFALSLTCRVYEDKIYPHTHNSNHKVIKAGQKFGLYKGEGYKSNPSLGTFKDGCNGSSMSTSYDNWGCSPNSMVSISYDGTPFSKERCEKILNKMKGL